jgi:lipopolysaccharide export system permease protein
MRRKRAVPRARRASIHAPMLLTDRYIVSQMIRPLLATMAVALLILVIERMLRVLDLVLGWRGGLRLVVEIIAFLVPHYLALALPLAFFLAICLTFGRMSRDAEMDAWFGSGFGLVRLARAVFAMGLLLLVLAALTVGYFQPYARYAYQAAIHGLTSASLYTLLREGTFVSLGDSTLLADRITEPGRRFERVFVYDREGDTGSSVTTAQRAEVVPPASFDRMVFRLDEGLRQSVPDPLPVASDQSPDAITIRFGHYEAVLERGAEDAFRPRGEHERELTLLELLRAEPDRLPPGVETNEVRAELHARLSTVATMLVLPLLAIPLGLGRRRATRSYGLAIGLVVLVIYNQVMGFGESLVEEGLAPWIGIWLPFAVLFTLSGALFWQAAFRVPGDRPQQRLARLLEPVWAALGRAWRRRQPG